MTFKLRRDFAKLPCAPPKPSLGLCAVVSERPALESLHPAIHLKGGTGRWAGVTGDFTAISKVDLATGQLVFRYGRDSLLCAEELMPKTEDFAVSPQVALYVLVKG